MIINRLAVDVFAGPPERRIDMAGKLTYFKTHEKQIRQLAKNPTEKSVENAERATYLLTSMMMNRGYGALKINEQFKADLEVIKMVTRSCESRGNDSLNNTLAATYGATFLLNQNGKYPVSPNDLVLVATNRLGIYHRPDQEWNYNTGRIITSFVNSELPERRETGIKLALAAIVKPTEIAEILQQHREKHPDYYRDLEFDENGDRIPDGWNFQDGVLTFYQDIDGDKIINKWDRNDGLDMSGLLEEIDDIDRQIDDPGRDEQDLNQDDNFGDIDEE